MLSVLISSSSKQSSQQQQQQQQQQQLTVRSLHDACQLHQLAVVFLQQFHAPSFMLRIFITCCPASE
jgi:hypothetical protein